VLIGIAIVFSKFKNKRSQALEEVEEIEIGNITIFLRKAIEEGRFEVVGSTRTRAIKVKR
jgi:hypothetical protein